jgi:hypothetical protein
MRVIRVEALSRSARSAPPPACLDLWWAHQDLNLEPTDYESAALTN